MFVKLSILFFYNRFFSNGIRFLIISLIVVGVYVIYSGSASLFNLSSSAYRSATSSRERTTQPVSLTPTLSRMRIRVPACCRIFMWLFPSWQAWSAVSPYFCCPRLVSGTTNGTSKEVQCLFCALPRHVCLCDRNGTNLLICSM